MQRSRAERWVAGVLVAVAVALAWPAPQTAASEEGAWVVVLGRERAGTGLWDAPLSAASGRGRVVGLLDDGALLQLAGELMTPGIPWIRVTARCWAIESDLEPKLGSSSWVIAGHDPIALLWCNSWEGPMKASLAVSLTKGTMVFPEGAAVTKHGDTWRAVRVEGWADGRDLRYVGASVAFGSGAASSGASGVGTSAGTGPGDVLRSWSGSGRRTTESFYVPDREWRIEWDARDGDGDGAGECPLYIYVRGADDDFYDSASGSSGETTVHGGPGRFYLELSTLSDCRWWVKVYGNSPVVSTRPPAPPAGPTAFYDDRLRWTSTQARLAREVPFRTGAFYVPGSLLELRWAISSAAVPSQALRIGVYSSDGQPVASYDIPVGQRVGGQSVASGPGWFYLTLEGDGFDWEVTVVRSP